MSSLSERLRGIVRPELHRSGPSALATTSGPPGAVGLPAANAAADILGGEWHEAGGQRFLVVDRKYTPGHCHGRVSIADGLPPSDGGWPRLSLLAHGATCGRLLFIDLETTGLAGGAGTYAFLVGCGWFDGGTFRVRQFFLSAFAAERALLEAVAELAAPAGTVVTYNGKTFDVPLMETRYLFHRMQTPFGSLPHLDMLHPARRLWRTDPDSGGIQGSCRLSALERTLCGHSRKGDVPGFEIPSRYFHYVRSGDARPLDAVFDHNRLDLVSLALVTARAAQLLEEGPAGAQTAREALGLGRLYERGGLTADARACFERAAEMHATDAPTRAEALRSCAFLYRRERRYEQAAAAWRRILDLKGCPHPITREANEALAIHHEHRLRDPLMARRFALQSMQLHSTPGRREALQHRLSRLNRKLGNGVPEPAPLF